MRIKSLGEISLRRKQDEDNKEIWCNFVLFARNMNRFFRTSGAGEVSEAAGVGGDVRS